jgi:hypothetical protein
MSSCGSIGDPWSLAQVLDMRPARCMFAAQELASLIGSGERLLQRNLPALGRAPPAGA